MSNAAAGGRSGPNLSAGVDVGYGCQDVPLDANDGLAVVEIYRVVAGSTAMRLTSPTGSANVLSMPTANSASDAPNDLQQLIGAVVDPDAAAARHTFAVTIRDSLDDISTWIAIESWVEQARGQDEALAFRGAAAVISMSYELTAAAVATVKASHFYAAATIVRQIIECEYFLTLFEQDFSQAARWYESSPEDVRKTFTPQKLRNLTGFANEEYWKHCSTGGHPAPGGVRLLEKMDPRRKVWPIAAAELEMDLGLHLHRIWRAADGILASHHSRYEHVRAERRALAARAWEDLLTADRATTAFVVASSQAQDE